MGIGLQFERSAVKIETTIKIRKPLPVVLIPENGPLREDVGRIGITRVLGHGPREQLALRVELDRMSGNGWLVDR